MAELKNLETLAQNVADAAAAARNADIDSAKSAILTKVENEVVAKVIKNELDVDLNQLATKAEVAAAGTAASEALASAVSTLNGTIETNRQAASNALSDYRDSVSETVEGINASIGTNTQSISDNAAAIAQNVTAIAQAQADITSNATAISAANAAIALKADAANVYTKQEVNELLGNAANVEEIIGTYTKDKIDELLEREMDVENTYSKSQADAKFATIATLTTDEGRIAELETKCQTVIGDIQANTTLATTANNTANDAQTVANGATTIANEAKTKATEAKSVAGEAKTTAESASATAASAADVAAAASTTATAADGWFYENPLTTTYNVTCAFEGYNLTLEGGEIVSVKDTEGKELNGYAGLSSAKILEDYTVTIQSDGSYGDFKSWTFPDGLYPITETESNTGKVTFVMPNKPISISAKYYNTPVSRIIDITAEGGKTTICEGESVQLIASVEPKWAHTKKMKWESGNINQLPRVLEE